MQRLRRPCRDKVSAGQRCDRRGGTTLCQFRCATRTPPSPRLAARTGARELGRSAPSGRSPRCRACQWVVASWMTRVTVVHDGFHEPRRHHGRLSVTPRRARSCLSAVQVRQPRVNDNRIDEAARERRRFSSAILLARSREYPRMDVLPPLYLHGRSRQISGRRWSSSSGPTRACPPPRAVGSPPNAKRGQGNQGPLVRPRQTMCTGGSTSSTVRCGSRLDKVGLLVIIEVRTDSRKELVALADGFGEAAQSWGPGAGRQAAWHDRPGPGRG
jgi:hypothetical protein